MGAGGQTAFVDYANNAGSNGTATSVYNGCVINANAGLIGSTEGTTRADLPAWLCHNSGAGANQFAEVDFNGCQFGGAGLGTYGTVVTLRFSGGTCGGAQLNATNGYFSGVRATQPFANGVVAAGVGGVVARNCVILPVGITGGFSYAVAGTLDYEDCTLDLRATTTNAYPIALFARQGALTMTWRDNVVLGSTAYLFALIDSATNADALAFDHNAYAGTASSLLVATAYNDGTITADRTFNQWQALGEDAGSIVATDLGVLADDSLSAASPAIDMGRDLGPATDYTGTLFAVRNDAGAFEYPLPALRGTPAGAQLAEGGGVTLSVPVAGNGPFTYQWLCNGAAVAGATGASLTLNPALPGQSGSYALVITNTGGSVTSAAAVVLITPLAFSSWQASRFTVAELANPAVSGPLADPDADGVCNLLEYAFGSDPRTPSAAVLPTARLVGGSDGPHLAITYRQLINATGVVYVVGVSSDLVSWDDSQTQVAPVGAPQPTGDGRTQWVTAQVVQPLPAGAGARQFLRVKIIDN